MATDPIFVMPSLGFDRAVMLALAQLSGAAQRAEKLEKTEYPMDIDPSRAESAAP